MPMKELAYLRESSPKMHRELVPPASPRSQLEACYQTLTQVLIGSRFNKSEYRQIVTDYKNLLEGILSSSHLSLDTDVAQRAVNTTVGLFDIVLINEISTDEGVGKGDYSRMKHKLGDGAELNIAFLGQIPSFMTNREKEQVVIDAEKRARESSSEVKKVNTVEEYLKGLKENPHAKYIFTHDLTLKELNMLKQGNVLGLWSWNVVIPVSFTEDIGAVLGDSYSSYPPSQIPRQELYYALLIKGLPIFNPLSPTTPIQHSLPTQKTEATLKHELETFLDDHNIPAEGYREKKQRLLARLMSIFGIREEFSEEWLTRHEEFYREQFGRDAKSVVLTRSGVSANEAATEVAADIVANNKVHTAAVMGGSDNWYSENQNTLSSRFGRTVDVNSASTLFVAYEPGEVYFSPDNQSYEDMRTNTIRAFLDKAKNEFKKGNSDRFVIVIDKTTNPLFSITEFGSIPPNTTVLETASLTKHQMGGSNYFFGGIWTYCSDERTASTTKEIREDVVKAKGSLTPWGIAHLPRINRRKMEELIHTKIAGSKEVLIKALQEGQIHLPENLRLGFQAWRLYGFFIPPSNKEDIIKHMGSSIQKIFLSNNMKDVTDRISFNLPGPARMPRSGTMKDIEGKPVSFGTFRFSYGVDTSPSVMEGIGRDIAAAWIEDLRRAGYISATLHN